MSTTVTDDQQPPPPAPRHGLVGKLWERFGHLVRELGKFGVVGGIAFAADLALFNIGMTAMGMDKISSKIFATVIAATIAFVGNRFWTWRHRARSNIAREYLLYFVLNAIGLGFSLLTIAITEYGLGSISAIFTSILAANIANLAGTALGTIFRFWSYRRWVFLNPDAQPAVTTPVTESN